MYNDKLRQREKSIDKVRSLSKKFNDVVPSKSNLEKLISVQLQVDASNLRRQFAQRGEDYGRQVNLWKKAVSDVERLKERLKLATVRTEAGEKIDAMTNIANQLDDFTNRILTTKSLSEATRLAGRVSAGVNLLSDFRAIPLGFWDRALNILPNWIIAEKTPGIGLEIDEADRRILDRYGFDIGTPTAEESPGSGQGLEEFIK